MVHIFVETNWVVDCCAPAHNQVPAAADLLRRAGIGEIQLHLPAICLTEARHPLSQKFQTRLECERVRRYVTWALAQNRIRREDATTVRDLIEQMEYAVRNELRAMEQTLRQLAASRGLQVMPYDAAMMERALEYGFLLPELKPYDQAVFASVIVGAEALLKAGEREMFFSELDSDLQPWDRNGARLEKLATIYDEANVWVSGDYLLQSPPAPEGWHNRPR
jgi:hypothetical protein